MGSSVPAGFHSAVSWHGCQFVNDRVPVTELMMSKYHGNMKFDILNPIVQLFFGNADARAMPSTAAN